MIEQAVGFFIWKGTFFKLPRPQIQLSTKAGGLGLINCDLKCKALLSKYLINTVRAFTDLVDKKIVEKWYRASNVRQTPCILRKTLKMISQCDIFQNNMDVRMTAKQIYVSMQKPFVPQIQQVYANKPWTRIWKNISRPFLNSDIQCTLYLIINDNPLLIINCSDII